MSAVSPRIATFLMFEGTAEAAMELYISLFPDSDIVSLVRHDDGPMAGRIMHAVFQLDGVDFMAIDSPAAEDFGFSPATSIFVNCEHEAEFDRLYRALGEEGQTFMEPAAYGFSRKFAWVADRFGVSWQINLP